MYHTSNFPPRRGLLFDATDIARIRANTRHPRFAAYWAEQKAVDVAACEKFLREELSLTNHVLHLLKAQQMMERAMFIYLVERDPAQLALAKLALRRMLDFSEWDYFVEGGRQVLGLQRATEGTFALLLALDCLGDALTAEEVAEVEDNILRKGVPACYTAVYGMKYPDRVQGWDWNPRSEVDDFRYISLKRWPLILNATNLKIIPTACLGIAACHFLGRRPEAEGWLELARSSAQAFATIYGSDGCYDEGVSYWGYTTLYLALFAEVLWRTHGVDERNLINYPGTVRCALAQTMPTRDSGQKIRDFIHTKGWAMPMVKWEDDIVNFGDANGAVEVSVAAWVARTHDDPLAQYVVNEIGAVKHIYGLIWFDAARAATPPGPELNDLRMKNDIVVSRTGWRAEDNLVALRSGGPGNHEHADRNSVIFKAHGERLLHDPFRAAYKATQPRWLLRQTEAHTAVLINGQGHQYHDGSEGTNASWAFAKVTAYATGPGWMRVTSDATDAYQLVNADVTRVLRTLVYLKPDVLVIFDQVEAMQPVTVEARFQVNYEDAAGQVSASGATFAITRPFATLRGQVAGAGEIAVTAGQLDLPPEDGRQPFARTASAAAARHEILTVCTAAPQGAAHGAIALTRTATGWTLAGEHCGQTIALNLAPTPSGAPEVTLPNA
ncbi:MAG: heparinase II/III family protein [Opitutaceae bacterium]|nr:heparinase II/III family protein [Opitutaceae bacterium]